MNPLITQIHSEDISLNQLIKNHQIYSSCMRISNWNIRGNNYDGWVIDVIVGNDLYTFYSHESSNLSRLVDKIERNLISNKISLDGPKSLPTAYLSAIRSVRDSKPLDGHKLLWLRNANPDHLGDIISTFDTNSIHGYEIRIPSRHTRARNIISKRVWYTEIENIYYTEIRSSESNHVPFSYDPNQEFKTEPEEWH